MWCVPELDDKYIANMEDVLATYERRGTANVFVAVEPKAGRHFTFPTPDRTAFQFAHLVMDNLNIHCSKSLTDTFGQEVGEDVWSRFMIHHTPTHGNWLNQAEIEIGIFSRQCLGKRRIPDLKFLRRECRAWNRRINRAQTKIDWRFDRKAAHKTFRYKPHSFKQS